MGKVAEPHREQKQEPEPELSGSGSDPGDLLGSHTPSTRHTIIIIIIIYLLRPWAAHKTYKDKKLKTTGTHHLWEQGQP